MILDDSSLSIQIHCTNPVFSWWVVWFSKCSGWEEQEHLKAYLLFFRLAWLCFYLIYISHLWIAIALSILVELSIKYYPIFFPQYHLMPITSQHCLLPSVKKFVLQCNSVRQCVVSVEADIWDNKIGKCQGTRTIWAITERLVGEHQ